MFGFLSKLFGSDFKSNMIRHFNKQNGFPQSASDWRVRAITCQKVIEMIEKSDGNKMKILALQEIKKESEENAIQLENKKINDYLKQFEGLEGYDKYIQVGGKKFAKEIWIYRNKSKIVIVNDTGLNEYKIFGDIPGKWYSFEKDGTEYNITLGTELPGKILVSSLKDEIYKSFEVKIELVK